MARNHGGALKNLITNSDRDTSIYPRSADDISLRQDKVSRVTRA